jgi:hypothetical protein
VAYFVVVVMNESETIADFYLWIDGKAAPASSLPQSIMTFVI